MSAQYVYIYPTPDYTGANPQYRVTNEERDLVKEGGYLLMLPNSGPYYADTLEVWDADTNTRLVEEEDYTLDVFESDATRKSNKDVFGAIRFSQDKYPAVTDVPKLRLVYQFVGGPFHANIAGLLQAVRDMENVAGIVYWDNIEGKPTTYPPSFHLHKASDITHLDSTNDILRQINTSIQELADRLVAAKEPKHNVTNAGRVKVALDAGRELNSGVGSEIWLQFPRSTNQNAQFGFTIELMAAKRAYEIQVLGKEHPTDGFEADSLSFVSDMLEDHPIESVEVSTLLGQSYLRIKPVGSVPGGYYVMKEAVVNYHTPEEWITPIIWNPAPPDNTDPEFKRQTVPVTPAASLDAMELDRNIKRNKVMRFLGEVAQGEKLALRFPKGTSKNHTMSLSVTAFTGDKFQSHLFSCLVSTDGTIANPKVRCNSQVDGNIIHVTDVAYDSNYGYLVFSHDVAGNLASVELDLETIRVSNNGSEINGNWEFINSFDPDGVGLTNTPIAKGDIVNLQSRHGHTTADVDGLDTELSNISNDLTTLGNDLTTVSDKADDNATAISNLTTKVQALEGKVMFEHTLDMTALNPAKLYLVELTPTKFIEPSKVSLAVVPNKDIATADHFGFVRGEFQFEDSFTRGNYFDYVAVLNDADVTKLSFDSVWYNKPTDVGHSSRLFFYVKGGETLGILTDIEAVALHSTGTVVIDNDGSDVTVDTEVDAAPAATAVWLKLTDLVGNSKASSI